MKTYRQCLSKYILYTCLGAVKKRRQYKQKLDMFKNNSISVSDDAMRHVHIDIIGTGNTVVVKDGAAPRANITIFGDNNTVLIDENVYSSNNIGILLGQNHPNFGPVHDGYVRIGRDCSFESAQIIIKNSNARLTIGDGCMFAFNITLYHTDSHPIFDVESRKIINKVKTMSIGNHVWVGANVTILKNTTLPDDCIIGWGSVVSGKFETKHAVIAGNPAKIVKTGVTWDSNGSKGYVQNEK